MSMASILPALHTVSWACVFRRRHYRVEARGEWRLSSPKANSWVVFMPPLTPQLSSLCTACSTWGRRYKLRLTCVSGIIHISPSLLPYPEWEGACMLVNLCYVYTFLFLKGRQTQKKRMRERECKRDIFHLLVHSPEAHNSQAWARLKPGIRNQTRCPIWVAGTWVSHLSAAASWAHWGEARSEVEPVTQLKCCAECSPWIHVLYCFLG